MKNLVKNLTVSCCICLLVVSCDKFNDIHKKYLDEGEQVYLGKNDSLIAYDGKGRVKLVWYVSADPKIESTVIYYNLRHDSIVKPFERTYYSGQKDSVIIDGLAEGTHIFELYNKNRRGESSLISTVQGVSYGVAYASRLKVRPVANLTFLEFNPATQSATIKITWDYPPEGCVETKLTYKKRSTGEEVVLDVSEEATETIVSDIGNRLDHPDDLLYVSSVYRPNGSIDLIESPQNKDQFLCYMASGTRIENTLYDGSSTTFTHTYVNQEKFLRLTSAADGNLIFSCSRVAELSPLAPNTSFGFTLYEDQSVRVRGNFVAAANIITDQAPVNSSYNPVTRSFTLRYSVKTAGGSYSVEETLVPKTLPLEIVTPKPFGDLRSVIPGDNTTHHSDPYVFSNISNGILPPDFPRGWLTQNIAGNPTSFTIDLHQKVKLSRVIKWPDSNGQMGTIYNNANILACEMWGVAELDESKLDDAAYWADAVDPAGTFKEDWEYLGYHVVERLDRKGAPTAEVIALALYGYQFIIPDSAGPIRYVRFYVREGSWAPNLAYFAIGELSFFGYPQ